MPPLRLGPGMSREAVRRAVARGGFQAISYQDVLQGEDIRATLLGIRDAGSPPAMLPLLAWFASHPNTPVDALRELSRDGRREVLLSLAGNRHLPADLRAVLLAHQDQEVRAWANQVIRVERRCAEERVGPALADQVNCRARLH